MNVKVAKSVYKEVEKIPKPIRELIGEQIEILENAVTLSEVPNVYKMQGTSEPYYRLKVHTYRFMMYYDEDANILQILSLTHRKDTYKKHNLPWQR